MPFHPVARRLFGFWTNSSRTRGSRRRFDANCHLASLESLESRTLLSAVTGSEILDGHMTHREGEIVECLPSEPINARVRTLLAPTAAPPFDLSQTFLLNSDPNADHTIYLDYNGHITTGTAWLSGETIDSPAWNLEGTSATFTDNELEIIQRMWLRVVEDFAPFNVNITTQEPDIERLRKVGDGDTQWGVRVVITPDGSWRPGAGGVAYLHSFADSIDTPAFVFNVGETGAAEAISHEVGHTLGLSHDGLAGGPTYYDGHGSGATSWSPIMGVGYYTQVSQWSSGQYPGANQTQDDLNIITNPLVNGWQGLTYRTDDHSDSFVGATNLVSDGAGALVGEGLISQAVDQDYFTFTTEAGAITIDVSPWMMRPNLDIEVELYNAAGQLLRTANPFQALDASITQILAAGTYFLRIDGVGKFASGSDYGYSDYGSLGQYSIRLSSAVVGEDDYEENDNLPSAADPRGNGGLWEGRSLSTIGGFGVAADADWYKIFVPDDERYLTATLNFVHAAGDLDLRVVDAQGRVVRTSASEADFEQLQFNLPSGGTYYLLVSSADNSSGNVYDLSWSTIPEPLLVERIFYGIGENRWIRSDHLENRISSSAIRQIKVVFNRDVLVDIADLTGTTEFGSNLRFASFHYNPRRFVATWTLAEPIVRDRVQLTLDGNNTFGDNSDGIRATGDANYLYGGDFDFDVSVLQGDVNNDGVVNVFDRGAIVDQYDTSYVWADVNGDGIVDFADALLTFSREREGWSL